MPNRRKQQDDSTASSRNKTLTGAEAEVMNVIWHHEPISMPDIVEHLPRSLAYTTVMTTVRILEEKGFVEKCGKQARAFMYRSLIAKTAVRGSMVRELAHRLFDGSLKSMVLNLIEDRELKAEELSEVKAIIQKLESRK